MPCSRFVSPGNDFSQLFSLVYAILPLERCTQGQKRERNKCNPDNVAIQLNWKAQHKARVMPLTSEAERNRNSKMITGAESMATSASGTNLVELLCTGKTRARRIDAIFATKETVVVLVTEGQLWGLTPGSRHHNRLDRPGCSLPRALPRVDGTEGWNSSD